LESLAHFQTGAENIESNLGCITYDKGDDQGSFLFIRDADTLFGVVIRTNDNEAFPITNLRKWKSYLVEAIEQAEPEELYELDLSADDFFIGAYDGDYDYQFVKFEK